ncbi:MAG: hypothetical protein Q4F31_10435, partial [Eubacteriales bacterium]|nr:hypothetical protein [Eubacteriales bacterium]
PGIRCTYISRNDLQPGDMILVGDDANQKNASEYFWNGEKLLGTEADPDEWIDSLFGKYCFAVIRPSLYNR